MYSFPNTSHIFCQNLFVWLELVCSFSTKEKGLNGDGRYRSFDKELCTQEIAPAEGLVSIGTYETKQKMMFRWFVMKYGDAFLPKHMSAYKISVHWYEAPGYVEECEIVII